MGERPARRLAAACTREWWHTALDAGAVVEDVAVECPLVTVRNLAPVFDVLDAAVGDGRFHAPAEVGAKTTRESGTGRATSKGVPDKLWWRHASSGLHSDGAVAFPDAMEHRVGFLFAELTIGIDVVSLFNESVFRPYRIAGDRAERTFLQWGEGVRRPGLDHLPGDGEVDNIRRDVVAVCDKLAGDTVANQSCPGLPDMPSNEAWAGGEQAELDPFVIGPKPWVRDVPAQPFCRHEGSTHWSSDLRPAFRRSLVDAAPKVKEVADGYGPTVVVMLGCLRWHVVGRSRALPSVLSAVLSQSQSKSSSLSLSLSLSRSGVERGLPDLLCPSDERGAGCIGSGVEVGELEGDVKRPSTGVGRGATRGRASDLREEVFVEARYGDAVHSGRVGALFDQFPNWFAAKFGHDLESVAPLGNGVDPSTDPAVLGESTAGPSSGKVNAKCFGNADRCARKLAQSGQKPAGGAAEEATTAALVATRRDWIWCSAMWLMSSVASTR